MKYDPDKHHRQSNRLKGFDYSQNRAYFFTVCVYLREGLLGEIQSGEMHLNPAGEMIWDIWEQLPGRYPVELDAFVVMPNHIHGIICLVGKPPTQGENDSQPSQEDNLVDADNVSTGRRSGTDPDLTEVIGRFKSITTNKYIEGVKTAGWPEFSSRLWQRNFHDRIIRDDRELNIKRRYIEGNPSKWTEDEENPQGRGQ